MADSRTISIRSASVPCSVTGIANWAADLSTILIDGVTKHHSYQYADAGVVEAPAAGAGKPDFAAEMLKALPTDDDSRGRLHRGATGTSSSPLTHLGLATAKGRRVQQ